METGAAEEKGGGSFMFFRGAWRIFIALSKETQVLALAFSIYWPLTFIQCAREGIIIQMDGKAKSLCSVVFY